MTAPLFEERQHGKNQGLDQHLALDICDQPWNQFIKAFIPLLFEQASMTGVRRPRSESTVRGAGLDKLGVGTSALSPAEPEGERPQ